MARAQRTCLGCGDRGPWDGSGRCPSCYREHKGKYGPEYRLERDRFASLLARGACLDCPRCGEPIDADTPWDLGHQDDGSLHPEHRHRTGSCPGNRGARRRPNPLDRFLL